LNTITWTQVAFVGLLVVGLPLSLAALFFAFARAYRIEVEWSTNTELPQEQGDERDRGQPLEDQQPQPDKPEVHT
jgi:Na+(H+)/acetate symporter ActP